MGRSGAYGTFKVTGDITKHAKANIFAKVGQETPCLVRFSTVAGERDDNPRWHVLVQVMPGSEASTTSYDPFDLTTVWPHSDYPLIAVGEMEPNRNRENYFAKMEQASFLPANMVPGIGHSPDMMLQFRIFSYADAHRYRLGVNHEELPVNRPHCPVHT